MNPHIPTKAGTSTFSIALWHTISCNWGETIIVELVEPLGLPILGHLLQKQIKAFLLLSLLHKKRLVLPSYFQIDPLQLRIPQEHHNLLRHA